MEGMQIKGKCPERPRAQGMDAAVFEHSNDCFITEKTLPEVHFPRCIVSGLILKCVVKFSRNRYWILKRPITKVEGKNRFSV